MNEKEIESKTFDELINLPGWLEIDAGAAAHLWKSARTDFLLWSVQEKAVVYGGEFIGETYPGEIRRENTRLAQSRSGWTSFNWCIFDKTSFSYDYKILYFDSVKIGDDKIFCGRCTWTSVSSHGEFCRWCK